ncbi:SIR2 family NAD-dependent protein deacylase [Pasteurella multocida]|uniref:SIR2 family NAD-dependent protein deacylase n=1 Tax=Pasteurella multocida TaxID=747 RepID=UPI000E068B23|nr:Sir2 family NAD-dependent protein deacetylase [Pasteurella multocida]MCL7818408.1 NAD-dependent deacetylase [Pasteurella multocida]MEB3458411.1 Sir2 family NAD-dependent protein deacetylase [Pasteurella multocida]MEB3487990.1 Sir2 family NAD-dependent protein deacetylase [Pasteurella multocida]MEB3490501.1 Sir2 family NAD-dependent protein deacetylase [Pasteurella multocida]QEU01326.1 NAD-dependent deacetylase [Pasteurella multocida]
MKTDLQIAADYIKQADGILITAGAGMSVDSGLPDFRSVGGFWNAYPPLASLNLDFQTFATPLSFDLYPQLMYWFWGHRLHQYRRATPHQGYQILQRWAAQKARGYFVFTSNVDGHFQKAGFDEGRVYEVHGTIERMQCIKNCRDISWSARHFHPEVDEENHRIISDIPRCPDCDAQVRQNVLMFDDWCYSDTYQEIKRLKLETWLKTVDNLVVIELGAGKTVPTVRRFGERIAKMKKGSFIRINPQESGVICKTKFLGLKMTALDALLALDEVLQQKNCEPHQETERQCVRYSKMNMKNHLLRYNRCGQF